MTNEEYKALSIREFDAAAEKFDDNDPSIYNLCRQDYPKILEELEKEPFTDVLDAGCGTGAVLGLLAQSHPAGHYTGIDLSEKMVAVAKKKQLANVAFLQGDCERLPFPPESFDAVLCSQSFHHYPNPEDFFSSVKKVLRPGGRLILRDMAPPEWAIGFCNRVEIPLFNALLKKGDVHVYRRREIEALCQHSGLKLECFERRKGMRLHCVCRKPV